MRFFQCIAPLLLTGWATGTIIDIQLTSNDERVMKHAISGSSGGCAKGEIEECHITPGYTQPVCICTPTVDGAAIHSVGSHHDECPEGHVEECHITPGFAKALCVCVPMGAMIDFIKGSDAKCPEGFIEECHNTPGYAEPLCVCVPSKGERQALRVQAARQ